MRDGKGRFTKYKDDGRKVYFLRSSINSIDTGYLSLLFFCLEYRLIQNFI